MAFTAEWLAACNEALAEVPAPPRRLAVTEELTGARPEGTMGAITLLADDDGVRLVAGADAGATASISISAADAEALNRGELGAAQAITEGRVRVRGDLQAVVDASAMLAAAHEALLARGAGARDGATDAASAED